MAKPKENLVRDSICTDRYFELHFHVQCFLFIYSNLRSKPFLHKCLSRALNIPLKEGCVEVVEDSAYVLTVDYTIKMLNIHERYHCGIPVILEGETGVGKTALLEMLRSLWNQSLFSRWRLEQSRLLDCLRMQVEGKLKFNL